MLKYRVTCLFLKIFIVYQFIASYKGHSWIFIKLYHIKLKIIISSGKLLFLNAHFLSGWSNEFPLNISIFSHTILTITHTICLKHRLYTDSICRLQNILVIIWDDAWRRRLDAYCARPKFIVLFVGCCRSESRC